MAVTVDITSSGSYINIVVTDPSVGTPQDFTFQKTGTTINRVGNTFTILAQGEGEVVFDFANVTTPVVGTAALLETALQAMIVNATSIGGFSEALPFPITTSATAYTANDNVGGIITLTNILRVAAGTGVLENVELWALANQKPNLYIDIWNASPSGTYTNDAAQVIAGDQAKWLAFIEVGVADWKDTGVISRAVIPGIGQVLKGIGGSRNLFATIQDKTGVTFGSTAGLFMNVGLLQD